MRRPMMAGNWKMNKTVAEAVALAEAIYNAVADYDRVDRVVCPAAVCLPAVAAALAGGPVAVGAQNVHWAESGAYTGEVSPPMLQGLAHYVIIGHSERRQYFAETDEVVHKKIAAALAHGLTPILCVGESLEQNRGGQTAAIVKLQTEAALAGLSATQVQGLIIAYEPIWAIGTGLAATAADAQEVCGGVVRTTIRELYGEETGAAIRVLYGGSTNEKNIGEIMQQPDIDGALIGGASLKAESYGAMVRITHELYAAQNR
jgi:triosephosphate isomerase (TIM)